MKGPKQTISFAATTTTDCGYTLSYSTDVDQPWFTFDGNNLVFDLYSASAGTGTFTAEITVTDNAASDHSQSAAGTATASFDI